MSNKVNMMLDVTKAGIQNPLVKLRQGDGNWEALRVTVTANGEPLELQGWAISFMGTTAGQHRIADTNVNIVEAQSGIFEYTPSKAWGMDVGEFKNAYFKFVKGDGSASTASFRVLVDKAVDITDEEAENYIAVFDVMIETATADLNNKFSSLRTNTDKAMADATTANANASAAVKAANDAVNTMNNSVKTVQVGGRNLLLGTANWSGDSTRWEKRGTVTDNPGTYRGMTIAATYGAWRSPIYKLQNAGILQVGKTYTFSTYVRNTSDTDTRVAYYYDNEIATQHAYSVALPAHTDWTRVFVTFKVLKDPTTSANGLRWEGQNELTNGQIQFAGYKLEEGNVPTDWTPAPEDAPSNDAQLVHKTGNETVAGDKTFTGKLSVNNLNVSGDTPNTVLTYNSGFSGGSSYYFVRDKTVHVFLINVLGFTAGSQRPFELPNSLRTSVPGSTYFVGMYGTSTTLVGFNGTQVYISTSSVPYNANTPLNAHLTWLLP
ncbi:virion structural protein [Weissella phage WCP30]|uniref:virion structural protein n=1 Tax=Weissella phage WCP30 TaxID=1837862 RepID=UPI0008111545|nr:virion structural protein [Weissella phage WCP30]ANU78866.1 structural protein [Weissella phage WCP30]